MTGAPRAAGRVERGAAAADHDQAPAESRRRARIGRREPRGAVGDPRLAVVQRGQALLLLRAGGDVDRIVRRAQRLPGPGRRRRLVEPHVDAHGDDARDLGVEHVAPEPVRRDAVAHQPAQIAPRLDERHAIAQPPQLVCRRESRRPAADDRNPLAPLGRGRLERPAARDREIADVTLELADRQRLVVADAVARGLARVVADASGDRGERVVAHEHVPRAAEVALAREPDPFGDVAVDRARLVAGRRRLDVAGQRRAPGPGPDRRRGAGRPDGREFPHRGIHAATSSASRASTVR